MKKIVQVEHYNNPDQQIESAQAFLEANINFEDGWLLEAGCGSLSRLKIPKAKLTGIDISQKQLDRNTLLTEKICGDLQTYPLEKNKFTLCICWDVIEHIKNPAAALKNMCNCVKLGGHVVLALPNVRSLKGLVTKFTPHCFHVWYYKNILGNQDAGKEDTAPFATYLNSKTSAPGITDFLDHNGFSVQRLIYGDVMVYHLKLRHYWLWIVYISLSFLLGIFTFGWLGGKNNSDFIVIAQKIRD